MYSENPKLKLPPGHPDGFNASDELIEDAAYLLWEHYLLPQNCKPENIGFCPAPRSESEPKLWVRGKLNTFSHKLFCEAMRKGHLCYGAAHTRFSNLFVIDVDDPDSGDEQVIREELDKQGWSFKCFHSGRGRHFWVFFADLPRKLLVAYGSGVSAMKAVGETFLKLHADKLTDKIDLRGCGNQLIKLPLQYDPYHKWVILPFSDDGVLIEDYELAVEYAGNIVRNDPGNLMEWLQRSQKNLQTVSMVGDAMEHSEPAPQVDYRDIKGNFRDYLDTVQVGPGESNDFIFQLVRHCWREGIAEDDIPKLVENLYLRGKYEGRVTCRDYQSQWVSKAKSQAKTYYGIMAEFKPSREAAFYASDLDWLARHARSERDRLFLAIHLWAYRMNDGAEYFLSRPKAIKFGISDIQYRSAKKKFEKMGLLIEVQKGKAGSSLPGIRGIATKYKFSMEPESCGEILKTSDPRDLVGLLELKEATEIEDLCSV